MMLLKENSEQAPLEFLARSPQGLWIKAIRSDKTIDVFWKPRFVCERDMVTVLDFNGDIVKKVHASEIEWGDEWKLLGSIDLVDEMVVMSGMEHFEQFVFGLMRHVVCLLTCGYGDDPVEVIDWFSDFGSRTFIVEDEYKVIGDHGQFEDLIGCMINVDRADDGSLSAKIIVRGVDFEFDLNEPEVFTSFVIATSPV